LKPCASLNGERLIILSAPSGTGKNAVCQALERRLPYVRRAVTATTRQPRSDEKPGVDYHYLTVEEFERRFANGEFAERNGYDDHCYGTPIKELEAAEDELVVLIIDVNGKEALESRYPLATTVFLMPPSIEVLRQRILSRNQNSPEEIERRLAQAEVEMTKAPSYDYVVLNDDLEVCADELAAIVRSVWDNLQG